MAHSSEGSVCVFGNVISISCWARSRESSDRAVMNGITLGLKYTQQLRGMTRIFYFLLTTSHQWLCARQNDNCVGGCCVCHRETERSAAVVAIKTYITSSSSVFLGCCAYGGSRGEARTFPPRFQFPSFSVAILNFYPRILLFCHRGPHGRHLPHVLRML